MNDEEAKRIRIAHWQTKWTLDSLACRYKMSQSAMRKIVNGYVYKSAGGPTGPTQIPREVR